MSFKELKQGYPVYILDRDKFAVSQGKVTSVSFPRVDTMPTGRQMVVDVVIESGSTTATYTMPEDSSVVYANSLVLSTDQQCLAHEVEKMKSESEQLLATVDRHRDIIKRADDLLAQLNPSFKEKRETEQRFEQIESHVQGMSTKLDRILKIFESQQPCG